MNDDHFNSKMAALRNREKSGPYSASMKVIVKRILSVSNIKQKARKNQNRGFFYLFPDDTSVKLKTCK